MESRDILQDLAPCGLSCRKCFAYSKGEICRNSQELRKLFGSFDIYAQRFSAFLPQFRNYHYFKELLEYFAKADCDGCRKGTCKYPNCGVAACYQQKGVDFCFQCDEFPCEKTNFDPHLKQRWIQMNKRMKEIGVESYYQETKDLCRYIA
jgi:hypothetical protein